MIRGLSDALAGGKSARGHVYLLRRSERRNHVVGPALVVDPDLRGHYIQRLPS